MAQPPLTTILHYSRAVMQAASPASPDNAAAVRTTFCGQGTGLILAVGVVDGDADHEQ